MNIPDRNSLGDDRDFCSWFQRDSSHHARESVVVVMAAVGACGYSHCSGQEAESTAWSQYYLQRLVAGYSCPLPISLFQGLHSLGNTAEVLGLSTQSMSHWMLYSRFSNP